MRGRWLCSPTSPERFYMIRPATLSTSAATGMPKHAAKAFQNSAWHAPKPFKFEARGGLGSQKIAFDQPSDAQERPRAAREAPKRVQEPPKRSQKPAKRRPRGVQNCFRPLPSRAWHAPRRVWSTILVESSVRQALGAILCCFLSCAQHVRFA